MNNKILCKADFSEFCRALMSCRILAAPIKKGKHSYVFDIVEDPAEICVDHTPTILPPKKYFMPQYETLLEFDTTKGQDMEAFVDIDPMVIIGVHTCDLTGIQCLNHVFLDRPKDYHYLERHNNTALIGIECLVKCDEFASCALMETSSSLCGYDLFMTDIGESYYIEVNTPLGDELLETCSKLKDAGSDDFEKLRSVRDDKKANFESEIKLNKADIPSVFEESFHHKVWAETALKCVSCGNCTNVCPTCYCFNVIDETELDISKGRRIRVWDSCQNESFALVAGGENFRENRAERLRHRFYRKFKYPVDRYGKSFCTGCGRCSRHCMAGIDIKKVLRELIKNRGE